ncbi:serine/threonine-protein kinase [Acanthopleuribacter pedis]|uniref:Serine/threonine protein kinase n=1 Tax=Acanthopleuribacter pedis TaxID=442870 RepID=A0A8J7U4L1_9BACT|nr:serine/threonine-protein kinase [Acanthopleuribacter pedis]MBO1319558.1 serine/threonine protein kinase [Acanthopleuribacter pedis]
MEPDIERMRRIHGVYKEALALPAHARAPFLDTHRAKDAELATAVEALLESAEQVETNSREVLGAPKPQTQIGPYRLLEEIGQGGVGIVYLAERCDETPMNVAVKLLKRGMDSDHVLKRFFKERQILAALNHPHIAQLFDAGSTDDGLPYFVMEYVDGQPIDQYCANHQLSLVERLRCFLQVCEAVRFAHQNLVIHRDLKPANILVTAEGLPKMLDFGISGLLDPTTGTPRTATILNERMLTVEYAAPEQLRGEPLGTPCDIYSLGVILYQLITGSRPHHFHGRDPFFAARQISASPPDRPSARIRSRVMDNTLNNAGQQAPVTEPVHRDIDNIVLKALAAEPNQRYRSVDQLMHDIHRYFKGLPVIARRAGFAYVLGKYLRRNRWTILFATVFFAMIGSAAVYTDHMQREAQRERDTADQALRFLADIFAVNDPDQSKGETITAKDLLEQSTRQIDGDDGTNPAVRSRLMLSMGRAYHGLGLFDEAIPHFEKALTDARLSYGSNSRQVGAILVELARTQHWRANPETVKPLLEEALAVRRAFHDESDPAVQEVVFHLGKNAIAAGDVQAASHWFALLSEGGGAERRAEQQYAAAVLSALGGNDEAAETGWLATLKALHGRYNHPLNGLLNQDLARLYLSQGRLDSAQIHLDHALNISRRLFSPHHPIQAENLCGHAELALAREDYEAVARHRARIVQIWERSLSQDHYLFSRVFLIEAVAALAQGETTQAENAYRQAVSVLMKHFGSHHVATARAQLGLAEVFYETDRLPEAAASASAGLKIYREHYGEQHGATRAATHLAACIALKMGENPEGNRRVIQETRAGLAEIYAGEAWQKRLDQRERGLSAGAAGDP